MTGQGAEQAKEAAGKAAEAVRVINHVTLGQGADVDVVDVYDITGALALLTSRLPQALDQLERLVEALVENGQVVIVDGVHAGDPVAAAAVAGHWLTIARDAAGEAGHALDQAQQALAWAAAAE